MTPVSRGVEFPGKFFKRVSGHKGGFCLEFFFFLFFFFCGGGARFQSDRGTITGTVADPAGAVVANAPIQAKNLGTGVEYASATSTTGNYTLLQLPPGDYQVTVSVPGFKKYTRSGLTVEVAQTLRIDIALEVGSATESVTVTESASLLKTESGELSHNVDVKKMDDLPVLGIGGTLSGSAGIRKPVQHGAGHPRRELHPEFAGAH